ncbi:MAG: hypothetical protein KDD32_05975 [Bacteroidetes bacterium]|nr:hypothetical protein [Bacteroidota bacterium]
MKKHILLLSCVFLLINSCIDPLNPKRNVLIRVNNVSPYDFEDLLVNTSGGENEYGNLGSDLISVYKSYDFAYQYAYVSLTIDGKEFVLQPIDYVGETKIPNGKYTYEINVDTATEEIDLNFIED